MSGRNRDRIELSSAEGSVASMSALPPKADMCSALAHVRYGSEADMCSAQAHVRFGPEADITRYRSCRQREPVARQAR
jgi:hypothetical protein